MAFPACEVQYGMFRAYNLLRSPSFQSATCETDRAVGLRLRRSSPTSKSLLPRRSPDRRSNEGFPVAAAGVDSAVPESEAAQASDALRDLLGASADLLRATASAVRRTTDSAVSEGQTIEAFTERGLSRLVDSAQSAAREVSSSVGDAADSAASAVGAAVSGAGEVVSSAAASLTPDGWPLQLPAWEWPGLDIGADVAAAWSNASVWETVSLPSPLLPSNGAVLSLFSSFLALLLAPVQRLWAALQFSPSAGLWEALLFYSAVGVLLLALANQPRE